ncbi:coiled-coil domain-containing protein 112 [Genypterus blacodes]|uniref:coiled-coil domain-containing protein 112 n=1 Tax=Genypterus blacodes TaxID=154954 RepID=UPI003F76C6D2
MAALATAFCGDGRRLAEEDAGVRHVSTSSSSGSSDRQKATQFIREAERTRRLIEKLERERTLSAQSRKNSWTDVSAGLEDCEKVLEEERNTERTNLQKQLVNINNGMRKFKKQLIDVKPTPELIEKLKQIMSEVEISINDMKMKQRSCFEELLKEERTCRQEINACEKKIENWSLAVKSDHKLPSAATVKTKALSVSRDLPAEVRAMEAFIQKTGGPYGGWDQFDHQAFLKVWTKHGGRQAYRAEAKLYLPGKTLQDIQQHEDWHQELIHLQDKKREAIQRWKTCKQQQRQTRLEEEAAEVDRREKEEAKRQAQQKKTEEERKEAARRLEQWKEEKRRKEEQEEGQRLAEEEHKRRQAKNERQRQLEVKLTVEEQLRLKREEEEEQERRKRDDEQREMDKKRKESAKGIKRFLERDVFKVEVKVLEKQLKEQQEEERQNRIAATLREKVEGHISRDPSRLIRPTKGWEERMKHVGSSGGGPVLQMFHRAVPTWRQGL